jgi:RNA recognition motif-containing protein
MRVFVRGLPADTNEAGLRALFSPFGEIVSAFAGPYLCNVEFGSDESANKAVSLLNGLMRGAR